MELYKEIKSFFYLYLEKKDKRSLVLSKVLAILTNLTIILVPLIQKEVLSQIGNGEMKNHSLILLFIITIVGTVALVIDAILLNHISRLIRSKLQRSLLSTSLRHKVDIIDKKGPGAFMVSIFGDTEKATAFLKTNYFSAILKCISMMIVFIIACSWSYIFPLVIIPAYAVIILILRVLNKWHLHEFKLGRELVYKINPLVLEFLENNKSILGYANIEEYENNLFSLMKDRDQHFEKSELYMILSTLTVEVVKTLSTVIFFCLAINEIYLGRLSIASFIAMTSYLASIFSPITSMQSIYMSLNQYKMYKDRIASNIKDNLRTDLPAQMNIALKECSFAYQSEKILDNVSILIDKKISLVGTSGEGKTTLINLLFGENIPESGECLFGGLPVTTISKFYLFNKIKLYTQTQELFDEDLLFNICLNKKPLSTLIYQDKIRESIKLINALQGKIKSNVFSLNDNESEFIKLIFSEDEAMTNRELIMQSIGQLNEKVILDLAMMLVDRTYYIEERYDNLIKELEIEHLRGRKFGQKGSKISGGEKNRVCLARFLLSQNLEYFVLDEPFVHLDSISEQKCLEVLRKYLVGSKGIIISHKLNIIKELSDEIIVLQNGKITGAGGHEMLLKSNDLYHELYDKFLYSKQDSILEN